MLALFGLGTTVIVVDADTIVIMIIIAPPPRVARTARAPQQPLGISD
jgi:hypothetical protein